MLISLIRTLIGMTGAVGLAFVLYAFSIFDLGFALIGFFVNLIVMGWAVGFFVCGLVLRFGLGAESLAWFLIFALAPFSCVYYPLSILPDWLEPVAAILPSAHVFEGMRALLVDGTFSGDHMMRATTAQHRLDGGRHRHVSRVLSQRPRPRPAAPDRGVTLSQRGR